MENDEFIKRTILLKARDQIDFVTVSVFMVICFAIGVLALIDITPLPKSLNETLYPVSQFAWATLLILGSSLSLVGRIKSHLMAEAIGSMSLAVAFLTYVVAVVSVNFPNGLAVAAVFAALVVKYGYRGWVLKGLARGERSA